MPLPSGLSSPEVKLFFCSCTLPGCRQVTDVGLMAVEAPRKLFNTPVTRESPAQLEQT